MDSHLRGAVIVYNQNLNGDNYFDMLVNATKFLKINSNSSYYEGGVYYRADGSDKVDLQSR